MIDIFDEAYFKMLQPQNPTKEAQKDHFTVLKQGYLSKPQLTQQDINELLEVAIIDEFLAEYNYMISYSNSRTNGKADFDPEFQAHEDQERDHKHDLIERLRTLDAPRLYVTLEKYKEANSCGLSWKQQISDNSMEILKNRLEEQKHAVAFYDFMLAVIDRVKQDTGVDDSTTKQLIKKIKADEEQHVRDLNELVVQNVL